MPELPLLPLPSPESIKPPRKPGHPPTTQYPSQQRQLARLGPLFTRLQKALGRRDNGAELRADPTSIAPERVLVFEVAGEIANFQKALSRIPGLELMAEQLAEFEADEDFFLRAKSSQQDAQRQVSGRLYLAMPDLQALQQLLRLWQRWQNQESLPRGLGSFKALFTQLRSIRPWGPQDRIPEETIAFWKEELKHNPHGRLRTEVELWYRAKASVRQVVSQRLQEIVVQRGGIIVHEAVVEEIAYHGLLVEISAADVQQLASHSDVHLALADDVMFIRPQSVFQGPLPVEPQEAPERRDGAVPEGGQPIAALLDGVPLQSHTLLADRLILDDPDNLLDAVVVSRRIHGTAMASLILHGDLNEAGRPLPRPLYVRPLLVDTVNGSEQTDSNRLLIDVLYGAVLRIKAAAPTVFVVNLSLGDTRRPFTRIVSPLARLVDFLAYRYGLLFLVSAGNVDAPLSITDYQGWNEFEAADPADRQRAVLGAVNAQKHERTLLSPAESLNAVTVGAHHHDSIKTRHAGILSLDPFLDNALPNITSAVGLGHRKAVKPEIYFPGGREYVQVVSTGLGLRVRAGNPQKLFGLRAATPDSSGQGRLNLDALIGGTSSATALATRTAHRIFDELMDRDGGSLLADIDPSFYAVVVKALLMHGTQRSECHEILRAICGPVGQHKHAERADNVSRFLGFGTAEVTRLLGCAPNRATLVGWGALLPNEACRYRFPLPRCLEGIKDPRSVTITVAWLSPIKVSHQNYRSLRFEVGYGNELEQVIGVKRLPKQPSSYSVKRGTVFHEKYFGTRAVPYIDDGHLSLHVSCKEDAGFTDSGRARYGIVVTVESESPLPVYEEIRERLRIRLRQD